MDWFELKYDWQTTIALIIVAMAVVVFVFKTLKSLLSSGNHCGTSCNSCPANKPDSPTDIKVTPLIQLTPKNQDRAT